MLIAPRDLTWPEIIEAGFPALECTLIDKNDIDTLLIANSDGLMEPATQDQKSKIIDSIPSVESIILNKRAKRANIVRLTEEYPIEIIYECLLDDLKLDTLKNKVREIEKGG